MEGILEMRLYRVVGVVETVGGRERSRRAVDRVDRAAFPENRLLRELLECLVLALLVPDADIEIMPRDPVEQVGGHAETLGVVAAILHRDRRPVR